MDHLEIANWEYLVAKHGENSHGVLKQMRYHQVVMAYFLSRSG